MQRKSRWKELEAKKKRYDNSHRINENYIYIQKSSRTRQETAEKAAACAYG